MVCQNNLVYAKRNTERGKQIIFHTFAHNRPLYIFAVFSDHPLLLLSYRIFEVYRNNENDRSKFKAKILHLDKRVKLPPMFDVQYYQIRN